MFWQSFNFSVYLDSITKILILPDHPTAVAESSAHSFHSLPHVELQPTIADVGENLMSLLPLLPSMFVNYSPLATIYFSFLS